ncbi:MAG: GAF domain-containing protein [Coleofasciculus sp. B1-GNL1-01]|uniref:GAF domain-containing protein n=1 Tax=Coleofasciculus sp. B1-GNL1-01 TaxID=3068484 RepID=UPI0032F4CA47
MGQQNLPSQNDHPFLALGRVLETLREEDNADVLIETTLNYLQTEFDYHLIWIGLYDRLDHRLFGKGGIAPTGDTDFLKHRYNLQPGDLLEQIVIQQRPITVPDIQQEIRAGEWRRIATNLGIQGTLLFPLRAKDQCFGVILLGSHQWGISAQPKDTAHLSMVLGGLAAALHEIEVNWQQSAMKRPEEPLFQALDELLKLPKLVQRLDKLVAMTQEFITPTRTNIYWYHPQQRYFWHRVGNRQSLRSVVGLRNAKAGLTVAEASDFYQALKAGQLVTIGSSRSQLKTETTEHILNRLRTRSLMAAPIQIQGELLGFLSVEENDPRIWERAERNYILATAQLVALVVSGEELDTQVQVRIKDSQVLATIAQVIACSPTPEAALNESGKLICQHLNTDRLVILQPDQSGQFTVVFSRQPSNRRPCPSPLPPLDDQDQQWLRGRKKMEVIEDIEADGLLTSWRETFTQLNLRSLLIEPLSYPEHSPKQPSFLFLIGHESPRTWNSNERDFVKTVAQLIYLLLTLSGELDNAKRSFLAHQTLQSGLFMLHSAPKDPVRFERAWINYVAKLLECPLVALLTWTPQIAWATVSTVAVTDSRFALPPDLTISVATNPLIHQALATPHFCCFAVKDLPDSIRQWFKSPDIGQILVIALHQDTTSATGLILIADHQERSWSEGLLSVLEILTQQFTDLRDYRYRLMQQTQERENLQALNWYKHRCLEKLYQSVQEMNNALLLLDSQTYSPAEATQQITNSALQKMRRQQLLHKLEAVLGGVTPILKQEQWQLRTTLRPIKLATLLKRSLRQVEPFYNQRQLVLNMHNVTQFTIYGDYLKLECIVLELLLTIGLQSRAGRWIHLWCCPLRSETKPRLRSSSPYPLLELLISQSNSLEECQQVLTVSPRKSLPSLNMRICQQILRSWGGDLQFYQTPVHDYLIRLLLPLEQKQQ